MEEPREVDEEEKTEEPLTEPELTAPVPEVTETPTEPPTDIPVMSVPAPKKSGKPKWFFAAIAAVLVLLIGGGAYGYLAVYSQTPENIWKSSLNTTKAGLQGFIDQEPSKMSGVKINGGFKVAQPLVADGSISGAFDQSSGSVKLDAGAAGIRANLELRALPATSSKTPDLYLNVTGIKNIAAIAGLDADTAATVDSLDGKWLLVDHTLLDQVLQSAGASTTTGLASESPEQITKDVQDIEKKMSTVLNERLFTDDPSKAVVVVKDKLAKEGFEGRKSQHLRVKVQKQQMHDFAVAMKDALKTSKLKDWLVTGKSNTTFEQATDFDSLLKGIDNANYDNAVADVWVDMATRTIRDVRVYDSPNSQKSYTDLQFNYTGGDDYPFAIKVVANNTEGSQNIVVGITLNRKTDAVKFSVNGTGKSPTGTKTTDVTASLELTPTNDKVSVSKPAGATNIVNLLGGLLGQFQGAQNELKVVNPVNSSFLDSPANLQ